MRKFRRVIDIGLPILGILIVFGAVLWPVISLRLQLQVLVVLVGILMIEAGVWKLTSPFLPSERKYNALRAEVDRFIDLVRALNSAALESDPDSEELSPASRRVLDAMHTSVDEMALLAGKETPPEGGQAS